MTLYIVLKFQSDVKKKKKTAGLIQNFEVHHSALLKGLKYLSLIWQKKKKLLGNNLM